MQGHALFTRQAGSTLPCPQVDFTGGFNSLMAAAYGIASVQAKYGAPFSMPLHCLCLRQANFGITFMFSRQAACTLDQQVYVARLGSRGSCSQSLTERLACIRLFELWLVLRRPVLERPELCP